jgi:hypothetical protein
MQTDRRGDPQLDRQQPKPPSLQGGLLEPCEAQVSRTVLRGAGRRRPRPTRRKRGADGVTGGSLPRWGEMSRRLDFSRRNSCVERRLRRWRHHQVVTPHAGRPPSPFPVGESPASANLATCPDLHRNGATRCLRRSGKGLVLWSSAASMELASPRSRFGLAACEPPLPKARRSLLPVRSKPAQAPTPTKSRLLALPICNLQSTICNQL